MKQMTLAVAKGFEVHGRVTRKAAFLARMASVSRRSAAPAATRQCAGQPGLQA